MPQDGRWRWILNLLSVTSFSQYSYSLTTDSKFSAIYHRVTSMCHLNTFMLRCDFQNLGVFLGFFFRYLRPALLHQSLTKPNDQNSVFLKQTLFSNCNNKMKPDAKEPLSNLSKIMVIQYWSRETLTVDKSHSTKFL